MTALIRPRWTGLLGIAWFVLFLTGAAVLQGEPPPADAPVAEVREFFRSAGRQYLVGDYLAGIAFMLLLVPFAVLLPRSLALPVSPFLERLAAAGAVALVVVGGTATSFLDAVAMTGGDARLDDSTVTALLYANSAGIALIGLPAALFAAATAAMLRQAAAPRALAALGWTAAALLVAGASFPIALGTHGPLWTVRFVSFLALALFVLATSVHVLTRTPSRRGETVGGSA